VDLQLHGGSRRLGEDCHVCHTAGAEDNGIGRTFTTLTGATNCTLDSDCRGGVATSTIPQWQTCQGATGAKKCTATLDGTASTRVYFPNMIHKIHSARLSSGYMESKDYDTPGVFNVSGNPFADSLLPMDLRNCTKCHADQVTPVDTTKTTCAADADCGFGQGCTGGPCVNVSFTVPSAKACITCHDTGAAFAHAQLNTYTDPSTGVKTEACNTCHGPKGDWAVKKVHDPSGFTPALADGTLMSHAVTNATPVMAPWFRSKEAMTVWTDLFGKK
jgi:hypothetical protein